MASFIFPSYCIHCEEEVKSHQFLCLFCSRQIEFASLENKEGVVALEAEGPALSLLRHVKGPSSEVIIRSMAAFMTISLQRRGLDLPDSIVPSPRDLLLNRRLASHISSFIKVPVIEAVKPLSLLQKGEGFRWNHSLSLSDQRVLVVDTTLKAKEEIVEFLKEAAPQEVIFLVFCDS